MIIDATSGETIVELSTLKGGSVFKWNNGFWVKTSTVSSGFLKAVNLYNGEMDGFSATTQVVHMPEATLTGVTY